MIQLFPSSDLWQCGILHAAIATAVKTPCDVWPTLGITWLPRAAPFCFYADPFGLWHDETLTVLAEAYDYRVKRGHIVFFSYDKDFTLKSQGQALAAPHHLSYPQIFAHEGKIYMLPEAHRSGKLTLYCATDFPCHWQAVTNLLDVPAIDATLFHHDNSWHCIYSLPDAPFSKLYHARGDSLTSTFVTDTKQPFLSIKNKARMGGAPFYIENQLHLPLQNCSTTYGGKLEIYPVDKSSDTRDVVHLNNSLSPHLTPRFSLSAGVWSAPYTSGLHTLSAAGPVTLFDVKRIHRSPMRHLINMQRRWRRLMTR